VVLSAVAIIRSPLMPYINLMRRGYMMKRGATFLMLSISAFLSGTNVIGAQQQLTGSWDPNATISYQTLDGKLEKIGVSAIWRIRATLPHGEPPGATVIDSMFNRIFVKDSIENVISQIHDKNIRKFTAPRGEPVYMAADKITRILRPIPTQHSHNTKAIIVTRVGQQQVQESPGSVQDALPK
jgi:hypothetical protein